LYTLYCNFKDHYFVGYGYDYVTLLLCLPLGTIAGVVYDPLLDWQAC